MTTTYEPPKSEEQVHALWREAQALQLRGDFAGAARCFKVLSDWVPANPHVAGRVALMAWHLRKREAATRLMAFYLDRFPEDAGNWYNFGKFHQDQGLTEQAAALYQRSILLKPSAEALSNLGLCLMEMGRSADAHRVFDLALEVDAESGESRFNRSFVKLSRGDFVGGWADYEARMECGGWQWSHERQDLPGPTWKGEPLWKHAILLVHSEQGLGDVVQFARFVPRVREMLGPDVEIRLEVPFPVLRLFDTAWPDLHVVAHGLPHSPYDAKVSILSLPAICGVTVETVPAPVPFAPTLNDRFNVEQLTAGDDRPRIGIAWAGSKMHPNDKRRSWTDDHARALLKAVPGVRWFSLQVGEREQAFVDSAPELAEGSTFLAAGKSHRDFLDSAELMLSLDLVVCVDTAVAHVAGSLGIPTLCCLHEPAEFRWMTERADTPWYPSMRLVRQRTPGDWGAVLDEVAAFVAQGAEATDVVVGN